VRQHIVGVSRVDHRGNIVRTAEYTAVEYSRRYSWLARRAVPSTARCCDHNLRARKRFRLWETL